MSDSIKSIEFSKEGYAAKINYSVPMPGAHTGRRIIELDLDLNNSDFLSVGKNAGLGAKEFIEKHAQGQTFQEDSSSGFVIGSHGVNLATWQPESTKSESDLLYTSDEHIEEERHLGESETKPLDSQTVDFLVKGWAGNLVKVKTDIQASPAPRFFIVEKYGISSFLGDYGMGKTVKTFTLLPGESTTISLKTWQSSTESKKESSSIIDSHEQSARERFADTVQSETTDKTTADETLAWNVSPEASASWGWGKAKVSGGANGEYNSSREEFSKSTIEAVKEHASEASSKRELSVSSTSETSVETGSETLIERSIKNANMRRTLNFVFRELNQEYLTHTHLKDVRVAFSNGNVNSWEEVPVSGLMRLLRKYLSSSEIEPVARKILKSVGIVYGIDDSVHFTLDKVSIGRGGASLNIEPAELDEDGEFPVPKENEYYRFKSGPLGQEAIENPVDGVLLDTKTIVMRTDSVIVEALLGQADALDEYAMEIQKAAAERQTIENERSKLINETLEKVSEPLERAKAFKTILHSSCGCSSEGEKE
ncbi:MAG: hypothetical protein ACPGN3_14905 [Opitutales bacterium]